MKQPADATPSASEIHVSYEEVPAEEATATRSRIEASQAATASVKKAKAVEKRAKAAEKKAAASAA